MQANAETDVRITKKAIKQIQKLSVRDFELVESIIKGFSQGDYGDYRRLEGYKNLFRTRRNDVRVIWTQNDNDHNNLLVIRAARRDKAYEGIKEDANQKESLSWTTLLDVEEEKTEDIPIHRFFSQYHASWRQFIYGGYLYSPVLTREQQKVFNELLEKSQDSYNDRQIFSLLIQSAPGTGKTICAASLACQLYENLGWHITLILPATLCEEVKEFICIKQIKEKYNNQD
ncbi:DEAD/DEAH box helicase family protein, partial [Parathermosynechococcus lividus]